MKRNDIDITISIMCKVQSILHDLDELSHSVRYRQEFKMRNENYYNYISKFAEALTQQVNTEEGQNYADIVAEFDRLGQTIKVEIDVTGRTK